MPLTPEDLERIAAVTLAHYDQGAEDFWLATRDHDVSQNIAALLQFIEAATPFAILDFGCGPGRDLQTFTQLGHVATGLEGSAQLAEMARVYSGCEVLQQNFLALDLPAARFDGVFANAALFHVPAQELPRVLRELHATLKPGGVLFSSNPRGEGQEGPASPAPGSARSPRSAAGSPSATARPRRSRAVPTSWSSRAASTTTTTAGPRSRPASRG